MKLANLFISVYVKHYPQHKTENISADNLVLHLDT